MAILLDGSMGNLLMSRVPDAGKFPETLNVSHSDVIRQIHREYAAAGSQIITTNTFTLNAPRAKLGGYDYQTVFRNALINAISAGMPVALDVGPLGRLMEPYGDMSIDEAYNEFARIIKPAADLVDYILIETMTDIHEADIAIRAALDCCEKPIFATMTFAPDGHSIMGTTAEQFASVADALGVNAVGFNCTVNPTNGHVIFEQMRNATNLPLIVQPNQLDDPDEFADAMMWYAERGAGYVGGCCGTTPAHIAALKKLL